MGALRTRSSDKFSDLLYQNYYKLQFPFSSTLLLCLCYVNLQMLLQLGSTPARKMCYWLKFRCYAY